MKTINIKQELYSSLESNDAADELFNIINNSKDNEIMIDFNNVTGVARCFAQRYFVCKRDSSKKIVGLIFWVIIS